MKNVKEDLDHEILDRDISLFGFGTKNRPDSTESWQSALGSQQSVGSRPQSSEFSFPGARRPISRERLKMGEGVFTPSSSRPVSREDLVTRFTNELPAFFNNDPDETSLWSSPGAFVNDNLTHMQHLPDVDELEESNKIND